MNRQVVWLVGAIMLASCGDGGGVTPDGQTGTPHVDGSDRTDPGRADADTSREGPSEVVGSYCPGGCAEGEICVFADADATEVSCVDPRPDIWDDGSDDDKRLVDVSGGWWRKRVDGWDTVNARCNDGSPYAYYIRPASPDSPDVNRWLLFFKGGGGCVTDESCAQRWVTERSLMNGSNGAFSPTKGD